MARSIPLAMANYTTGALVIAFVIFVTARGELGEWIQLFLYTPPNAPPPAPAPQSPVETPATPEGSNAAPGGTTTIGPGGASGSVPNAPYRVPDPLSIIPDSLFKFFGLKGSKGK